MRCQVLLACGCLALASGWLRPAEAQEQSALECPVTKPNRHPQPEGSEPMPPGAGQFWYGNSFVGTALWPEGRVVLRPGGPGAVLPDGALRVKFLWLKRPGLELHISGYRIDDSSAVLRVQTKPSAEGGMQPSHLVFATPGCWQITANAGGKNLTFVTSVVRIGTGPRNLGGE